MMKLAKAVVLGLGVPVLSLLLLAAASCSPPASSSSYERVLAMIPDTPGARGDMSINDYARMRRLFNVAAPPETASADEQWQYLLNLANPAGAGSPTCLAKGPGFGGALSYAQTSMGGMNNLGISIGSVEQDAQAGIPPKLSFLLTGSFKAEASQARVAAGPSDDPPAITEYGGSTIYGWGGDYEVNLAKRFAPPAYDNLGRGGRFVFQDDRVFRTIATGEMELLIDTQSGKASSLADAPEYRILARELDALNSLSAYITNQTQSVDLLTTRLSQSDFGARDIEQALAQGPRLRPYQVMALGVTRDEKGFCALIVLVHAEDKAAAENVDLLRRRIQETSSIFTSKPWTEYITESMITSRGRALTARLYGEMAQNFLNWYYKSEPLILHE